jgi:hypothetical protein
MPQSVVRSAHVNVRLGFCAAAIVAVSLAGCAGNAPTGGDPGAKPLPAGTSCQSLQGELNKMVGRGVQSSVEAQAAGRKLSPSQKTDADRYNQLLAQYLGSRCHV